MTDLPPSAPQPRSPVWMRVVLALSLTLNLAVLGIVGGAALRSHDERRPAPVRDLGFGPFDNALTPEDRKELRRAFMDDGPDIRSARRAMRQDFAAILEALRAEPFDPAALQQVLDRQNARGAEMLAYGQKLIFERVAAMDPEARRAFADRLEQSLTRKRGPDKREHPREETPRGHGDD
ncbi:putative membrane protein [Cereibacter changlensis]|uniref:Putative membrane protein n=3 Tax=Cereibacter changlensis TaxID=402884 RepID=A0A2W7QYV4_9RHOB|nr:periplasmic heavy metal sensor [Cereibacter changlensis]PZX53678.1 putative membrane protein [Cereibacter changlensis]